MNALVDHGKTCPMCQKYAIEPSLLCWKKGWQNLEAWCLISYATSCITLILIRHGSIEPRSTNNICDTVPALPYTWEKSWKPTVRVADFSCNTDMPMVADISGLNIVSFLRYNPQTQDSSRRGEVWQMVPVKHLSHVDHYLLWMDRSKFIIYYNNKFIPTLTYT